jgi:hypothetical protein
VDAESVVGAGERVLQFPIVHLRSRWPRTSGLLDERQHGGVPEPRGHGAWSGSSISHGPAVVFSGARMAPAPQAIAGGDCKRRRRRRPHRRRADRAKIPILAVGVI